MGRVRIENCPAGIVIAVAITALVGVFLFVSSLAEHPRWDRLGFEALLLFPLIPCSMLIRRVGRS